jgi:hypothetical protein
MRYLTLGEVIALHRAVIDSSGGAQVCATWPHSNPPLRNPAPPSMASIFTPL